MTLRTTRPLKVLTALVFALAGAPVFAQPVYKCVADDGKVTYSQNPCYGEQWHRLGEARTQRKPASESAAPASTPEKAATDSAPVMGPKSAASAARAASAAMAASAPAAAAGVASSAAAAAVPVGVPTSAAPSPSATVTRP